MLTLFTVPKPFKGHIDIIQRNTVKSWKSIKPEVEIILFGKDEGTMEVADEYGVTHVPDIEYNSYGTPLLSSIFEQAKARAKNDIICYANADIILMNDIVNTVKKIPYEKYLIVGQRWNVDITESLTFEDNYEDILRTLIKTKGERQHPAGSDYFIFPKHALDTMPPFAVGRPFWDNWMIYHFRYELRLPVIDGRHDITVIHQNHHYNHVKKQRGNDPWSGPEADKNLEILSSKEKVGVLIDCSYKLHKGKIKGTFFDGSVLRERMKRKIVKSKDAMKRRFFQMIKKLRGK